MLETGPTYTGSLLVPTLKTSHKKQCTSNPRRKKMEKEGTQKEHTQKQEKTIT